MLVVLQKRVIKTDKTGMIEEIRSIIRDHARLPVDVDTLADALLARPPRSNEYPLRFDTLIRPDSSVGIDLVAAGIAAAVAIFLR